MSSLSTTLNIASVAISVISLAFFVVGAIGFADQREVIYDVPWIYVSESDVDVRVGLRKIYGEFSGTDFSTGFKASTCTQDYCKTCEEDGKGAFGLLIISIFLTTLVIIFSGFLIASHNAGKQIANVFVAFAAGCASLVAIGLFMGSCFDAIDADSNLDFAWGVGSILTILAMGMMWVVVVLQIVASAVGSNVAAYTAGNTGSDINRF